MTWLMMACRSAMNVGSVVTVPDLSATAISSGGGPGTFLCGTNLSPLSTTVLMMCWLPCERLSGIAIPSRCCRLKSWLLFAFWFPIGVIANGTMRGLFNASAAGRELLEFGLKRRGVVRKRGTFTTYGERLTRCGEAPRARRYFRPHLVRLSPGCGLARALPAGDRPCVTNNSWQSFFARC
jgi:hypothetical protein